MRQLNLAKPNDSEIKFEISKFPDGQQSLTIKAGIMGEKEVMISSRFNSFKDLELILSATHALREEKVKDIHLYIPYVLGGRSDRKFEKGSFNYLKCVIAPIINLQGYTTVTVLDPHSDVLEACLNNFEKIDNTGLVNFALKDIYKGERSDDFILISPDAGALKKVYNVAEKIRYTKDLIIASKHRDLKTAKITHTEVPGLAQTKEKEFIIIDDLCDGGRTFIELSKEIMKVKTKTQSKIYLIVTHGIFSAGFLELGKYFDRIYTTNSIHPDLEFDTLGKDFVKLFDIF